MKKRNKKERMYKVIICGLLYIIYLLTLWILFDTGVIGLIWDKITIIY